MKANLQCKMRNGKESAKGEVFYEAEARILGEYHRSETPDYVAERRAFDKSLRQEKRERDRRFNTGAVIVRKRHQSAS